MYRLRSLVDESLNVNFECFEDMLAHVGANSVSGDDAVMEEWVDDREAPPNSGWRVIES